MSAGLQTEHSEVLQLVESIDLPMARWGRDGRLLFCNRPYEAWTGRLRDELLGKTLPEIFGAAAWAVARIPFDRAFAGRSATYERQVRMVSGEFRWHRVMVFPDAADAKTPFSIFTIAFDIEDDIRLRQQLAASEARMRSVLESIDIPIARLSRDSVLLYANSSYAKFIGVAQSEIPGKSLAQMIGETDAAEIAPYYVRALRGETVSYDRLFTQTEPQRWVRIRVQPERDAAGAVRSLVASVYDINTDVAARAKLEEARKRLDDFANSIPFSLSYVDRNLRYRFANKEFLRRHQLTSADVMGKHPREARGADMWERTQAFFEQAFAGKITYFERPITLGGGDERWTRTVYAPDIDETGTVRGVYTTSFDIHELKQAQSEVSRVNERLAAHIARSPVAVVEYDEKGVIVQWSPRAEEVLGYSAAEMNGTLLTLDIVHPDDKPEVARVIKRIMAGGESTVMNTHRYRHKSGRYVWIEWYTSIISRANGATESIMSLGVDRTERTEARLRLQRLADRVPNPITYVGTDLRYVFMNTAFTAWTGITKEQMIGKTPREVRGDQLGVFFERAILRALAGEENTIERFATLVDGSQRWVKTLFSPDFDDDGQVIGCYNVSFDVHDAKLREETLRTAAEHDPLTGLLTRRALFTRLDQALAENTDESVAVMFVDLDGFKPINDSLGHATGDEVLVTVASVLKESVRSDDVVARFGGDEFVIVAKQIDRATCEAVAGRIVDNVQSLSAGDGSLGKLGASVGIALTTPGAARDSDTLVRSADQAMYQAKRDGGSRLRLAAE